MRISKIFGVMAIALSMVFLISGCTEDNYATSKSFSVTIDQDTTVRVDLNTGAFTVDFSGEAAAGASNFKVISFPENGQASILGNYLYYTPSSLWTGIEKIKLSEGEEDEDNYGFIYLNISVKETKHAPKISGIPTTTIKYDTEYVFTPTATDIDKDDVLVFSIANKPDWISFDSTTGELRGVSPSVSGSYRSVTISVSDGTHTAILEPFTIDVVDQNTAPTISGFPTTDVRVGQEYYFEPIADDADGDELRFQIASIPAWGEFNTTTGVLSGTVSGTGEVDGEPTKYENIIISVTDEKAITPLPAFTIEVR